MDNTSFENLSLNTSWVIVKYKKDAIPTATQNQKVFRPISKNQPSILDGLVKKRINKGQNPIDACNTLLKDPNVLYAEPIVMDRPLLSPSDPLTSSQYYLDNIRAYDAWDITRGDDDITIGIIDTGVDMDHEDLLANLWTNEADPIDGVDNDENGYVDDYWGYDFANEDNDPEADQSDHGVRVAGIAGATSDNGSGMAGIGFNTKIAALKGFRSEDGLSNGLFEAIYYAANNGIQVLNLSWGSIREPLQSEQDIINYAVLERDVVIVAAAGNDGNKSTAEEKFYPASYDNVLSVGGSDEGDNKWSGSSYNYAIDLIAPASNVLSTIGNDGYNSSGGFGTSFASPMVAAASALVKDQFPELNARQIMERVRVTADDIYEVGSNVSFEGKLGKGRLNVYRAVAENNLKSMRLENTSFSTSFGSDIFFGDTVHVTATLTNFLEPVDDPSIYLTSPESDFSGNETSFFPGFMNTLDTEELSFDIILNEDIEPDSDVAIRFDFTDGIYTDFQHIELTTSPDYIDFGNENIVMTTAGNGDLGFVAEGFDAGSGLIYHSDTLLRYTGILFATSDNSVADNIIRDYGDFERETDFSNRKNYRLYHHPGADHFGYSEFMDPTHNLIVEQSNIAWNGDDFFIIRYRIVNDSPDPIADLSLGLYADWDLEIPTENTAEYDATSDYLSVRNSSSSMYAATKVMSTGTPVYSALDLGNENGNTQDIQDLNAITDSIKYEFLVNEFRSTAGTEGNGNDVAGIHGVSIGQLEAYTETFVNVVYAVSDSQTNLEAAFVSAETKLNEFLTSPRVLEQVFVCDGSAFELDPSSGTNFEFYEDPLGTILISTGVSLSTSGITSDTSIYVRNIDQNYPSDIFEIELLFITDIADFSISTDTLYLDNPTTNIVQFTDQSIDPVSWSWEFGQGTNSTIQNPTFSYNQPGSYTIRLTIENEQGCIDSIEKTLVVANRPSAPMFEDFLICPGTSVLLSDANASSLKVFASESQTLPELEGNSIEIGPFAKDSTLFVSGIFGGFESDKTPVNISVHDEVVDFSIIPDTLSESHQLIAIAHVESTSTIQWYVDGSSAGTNEQLTLPANQGTTNIRLEVTTENSCTIDKEVDVLVNSSPTPTATNLTGCVGESLTLIPENGNYFGFYEDAELTTLISKGTQLEVQASQTVFVVGLDDGLPGEAIEVDISIEEFLFDIEYTSSIIGEKNRVDFTTTSNQEIVDFKWYVNSVLTESSASPSLFFDNEIVEVVLEATSTIGCLNYDTLQLDFIPPLGVSKSGDISIYPNPTAGMASIVSPQSIEFLRVITISGKEVLRITSLNDAINLSSLSDGVYIIEFELTNGKERLKILKESAP